jgi:YVTN family beta-propeller protein
MIDKPSGYGFLLLASFLLVACGSQKIAFVGSGSTDEVAAFNPDGTIEGKATVPNVQEADRALLLQDDGEIGYVPGAPGTIHAVDLTSSPPALRGASATVSNVVDDMAQASPILIVSAGRDTTVGGTDVLVSSVFTGPMQEADALNLGQGSSASVDVCDDGSTVLVAVRGNRAVHKLTIDSRGRLTDTGLSLRPTRPPADVQCAPGSQAGIVVGSVLGTAQTFTIGGLNVVETVDLAAGSDEASTGHSADFTSSGDAVFVVSSVGDATGNGYVERMAFNPSTGAIGSTTERTIAPVTHTTQGIGLVGVGPDDQRVYVTEQINDRVLVLDATTLAQENVVSGAALTAPLAIDVEGN